MKKKFEYIDRYDFDKDAVYSQIKLIEGEFADTVIQIGEVGLVEAEEGDEHKLTFSYDVIDGKPDYNVERLEKEIFDIICDIILEGARIGESTSIDTKTASE